MTKDWDRYFYQVAQVVASNSKCHSTKVGAVLVRDKSIISTGYNGPPRGVGNCDQRWLKDLSICHHIGRNEVFEQIPDEFKGKCPRYVPGMDYKSGKGLEWCVAGHAERNALINAARMGTCVKGSIMYVTRGVPCTPCLIEIINAGVEEVVIYEPSIYDVSSPYLLQESSLRIRQYSFIENSPNIAEMITTNQTKS